MRHGYVAYFPATIPRAVDLPASTVRLLGEAEGALGRLAGIGRLLPNPDLLIRPYLLREALSSTRIEGTQASMAEVFEADAAGEAPNADVEEVVNYVAAMRWGLERLDELPLSTRLLCEMHRRLMDGVRGRELAPGELRTGQNIALRESYLQAAATMGTPNALTLVDLICENPVVTTRSIEDRLDVSRPTALRLLRRLEEQGVLTEAESGARGQRRYVARAMMEAVVGDQDG